MVYKPEELFVCLSVHLHLFCYAYNLVVSASMKAKLAQNGSYSMSSGMDKSIFASFHKLQFFNERA